MGLSDSDVVDILLVEDNPRDAELTIRAIKKRNLANPIHLVEDGAEALDFIFCRGAYAHRDISRPPKVILLDLKLPKLSGLEVLKAIKSEELSRSIPVVVVTSSREDPDIKAAYALGANSYVVKPVDFDLVITDYTMPKMTGTELAEQIVQIRPDIPIILCTGFNERINEEGAKKAGICALMMKPGSLRDIVLLVRKVLKTKES